MGRDIIAFSVGKRSLTACISCEIDHHTAKTLRESIDKELFLVKPEILIVDFSAVKFMDSSGIALILGRVETMSAFSGAVQLRGLSMALNKLIRLSGLDKVKNLSIMGN